MKKIFLSFLLGIIALTGFAVPVSFAQNTTTSGRNVLELNDTYYDPIIKNNIVKNVIDTGFNDGTENSLRTLMRRGGSGSLMIKIYVVIGAIAMVTLVLVGVKFIFANGKAEDISKYKTQIAWIVLGLAIISVAEFIAFSFLDPSPDVGSLSGVTDLTANTGQNLLYLKLNQIKLFVEIFITGVMLIMLTVSGYKIITGGDDQEETLTNEKHFIRSFFFGAFLILMAEVLAQTISNRDTKAATVKGMTEMIGLYNYILTFVAVVTTLMLILASIYYVASFGNEEQMTRAKKTIMGSVIGIVVIISSYAIVAFVIRGV